MMEHGLSPERAAPDPDGARAYEALHLLPSAPRGLAREVYRCLKQRPAHVERAYRIVMERAPAYAGPAEEGLVSPWRLLHIAADAPPEVVDAACRFRERSRYGEPEEDRRGHPAPNGAARSHEPPARPAPAEMASPPPAARAAPEPDRAGLPITSEPLRLGTDPGCDVVVQPRRRGERAEARLWFHDGRYMFHAVTERGVALNGKRTAWAVLESGDRLSIGGETFLFEDDRAVPR